MSRVLLGQADARHLPLADASVHCCVTSPPFFGLRDYGTGTWHGGDPTCTHHPADTPERRGLASSTLGGGKQTTGHQREGYREQCPRCGGVRVDRQLGQEVQHDCNGAFTGEVCGACYICGMRAVCQELWRVLRSDGTFWLNIGDSYNAHPGQRSSTDKAGPKQQTNYGSVAIGSRHIPTLKPKNLLGIPWRVALALQADGWYLRSAITWCKAAPMPESVQDRPSSATEMLFLLTKASTYFYDADAVREDGGNGWHGNPLTHLYNAATKRRLGQQERQERPGRNRWNYWVLNPEPVPLAHFATFPTALASLCLEAGTSVYGVCPQCGGPWRRVMETVGYTRMRWAPGVDQYHTKAKGRHGATSTFSTGDVAHKATIGWAPTCACYCTCGAIPMTSAHLVGPPTCLTCGMLPWSARVPATVLDPFCGSGTTLLAARALGRQAVGLDLSWDYLKDIARVRLSLEALDAWTHGRPAPALSLDDLPLFAGSTPCAQP